MENSINNSLYLKEENNNIKMGGKTSKIPLSFGKFNDLIFKKSSKKQFENLLNREWKYHSNELKAFKDEVSVSTFNILADNLIDISLNINRNYLRSSQLQENIKWCLRKEKILNEIKFLDSDIISLQEIEDDKIFIRQLKELGYDLKLKSRLNKKEGCAILWKKNIFELIHSSFMCFNIDRNHNKEYVSIIIN